MFVEFIASSFFFLWSFLKNDNAFSDIMNINFTGFTLFMLADDKQSSHECRYVALS